MKTRALGRFLILSLTLGSISLMVSCGKKGANANVATTPINRSGAIDDWSKDPSNFKPMYYNEQPKLLKFYAATTGSSKSFVKSNAGVGHYRYLINRTPIILNNDDSTTQPLTASMVVALRSDNTYRAFYKEFLGCPGATVTSAALDSGGGSLAELDSDEDPVYQNSVREHYIAQMAADIASQRAAAQQRAANAGNTATNAAAQIIDPKTGKAVPTTPSTVSHRTRRGSSPTVTTYQTASGIFPKVDPNLQKYVVYASEKSGTWSVQNGKLLFEGLGSGIKHLVKRHIVGLNVNFDTPIHEASLAKPAAAATFLPQYQTLTVDAQRDALNSTRVVGFDQASAALKSECPKITASAALTPAADGTTTASVDKANLTGKSSDSQVEDAKLVVPPADDSEEPAPSDD